jgi:hypothetical protein
MAKQRAQRKDKDGNRFNQGVIFGRSWAWLAIVFPPLVMLVLPAEIIGYIVEPGWPLSELTLALSTESEAIARHINHRIKFAAVIMFHVSLCVCLMVLFWGRIRDFPGFLRHRAYVLMIAEGALFLAVLAFYWRATGLYKLSYLNIRELLARTCVLDDLLAKCIPGCVSDGSANCVPDLDAVATKLSMFVYIPHIFSIATVAVAVAVAGSVIGNLQQFTVPDWQKRFDEGVKSLQFCFFGLSAVLVTSTATATLFFQFPVSFTIVETSTATVLTEYARTLAVFWGTVYTLTLVATFAPAALILRSLIRRYEQGAESSVEFKQWLTDKALISPIKLITTFLAALAPLLFGAAENLIKFLPGGG